MSSTDEGETTVTVIAVDGPIVVHQGRYRLYRKPDGGLHLVYQRDDSDMPDHMELPSVLINLAQAAGEGRLSLPEMMKEVMKLRNTM